ncbi:hypothetical protein ACWIUD_06965 [Helicobacter sp. 23-1044]
MQILQIKRKSQNLNRDSSLVSLAQNDKKMWIATIRRCRISQ